jgi:AcrR family transcriptional regulator
MNLRIGNKAYCPFNLFLRSRWQGKEKALNREQELIELAHDFVNKYGFTALNMDKLAAQCSYSKGTVYNHFKSKEDLISALAIYGLTTLNELIAKAAMFEGTTREKSLALHYAYHLYSRVEPTLFNCVVSAGTPSVKEKSSQWRLDSIMKLDSQISQTSMDVMQQAIDNNDLPVTTQDKLLSLTFANWAMGYGTIVLLNSSLSSEMIIQNREQHTLLNNINMLLDGMEWQALSAEVDYQTTWRRIEQQIFAEEVSQLTKQQG